MLYSRPARSGIQIMIYLALNEAQGAIAPDTIREVYEIPDDLLESLVQKLADGQMINRVPGAGGGLKLSRKPADITLLEIVNAIEAPLPEENICVLGLDECSDAAPCPLHNHWTHEKSLVHDILNEHTLAGLCEGIRQKREELS